MREKTDAELLRDYAERGHEAAFRELVTRYTDLVYSASLRQLESADQAGDITQGVFLDLARKARPVSERLAGHNSLAGWLHRSTRYAVLNHLRDTRRRVTNESQAMEQLLNNSEASVDWEQIRPALDEALDNLGDEDREALLLRYFKNQDLRTAGAALGVSDDAAQKRVSRAVERLREFFAKRGVSIRAGGLVAVVSANAVQAAPAGLALTISTAAALGGTAVATSTVITATTKTIAMTTLQKIVLVGGLICAAALTALLTNRRNHKSPTPSTTNNPVVAMQPSVSPKKTPAVFWRRMDSLQTADALVKTTDDGMRDTLSRLKEALYAPKSSGSRSDDPAYKLLYSIPLEKRAVALEMVMAALHDQNQAVCRRAISLIPLIWPQGEAALPDLCDLIRTKSQEWPGLASEAFMAAVQVRSETDVIPELVLAAMQGGRVSQQEFALQLPIIMAQVKESSGVFAVNLRPYLDSLDASTRLTAAQLLAQLPGTTDKSVIVELTASLGINNGGHVTDNQIRTSLNALMKMGANAQEAVPSLLALGDARPDLEDSIMVVLKAIAPDDLKGVGAATPLPKHDEQSQTIAQTLANGTLTIQGAIEALKDPVLMLPTARALADYGPNAAAALPALRDALAASYSTDPNSAMVLASVIERLDPKQPKPLLMAWDVLPALNAVNAEATKDNIAGVDNAFASLREKLPVGLIFSHGDIRQIFAALNQLDPRLASAFQAEIISADSKSAIIFQNAAPAR